MDYLWTPWRYQYVTQAGEAGGCALCAAAAAASDREGLVVHRARHNFILLNKFPYTSGHVMVIPYAHVGTLLELPDEALTEMMLLGRDTERCLRAVYRPEGLNLGINLGRSAGAGIAGHVHMHVLPRWTGDTNFMTAVGETRVLPEDLSATWERLAKAFSELKQRA
jgi:ATP adenylyltransferase